MTVPATTGKRTGIARKVSVPDIIGSLMIIGVGLFFAIGALDFGVLGEGGRLAPGGMPFFAGAVLALFGAGVLVTSLFAGGSAETTSAEPPDDTQVSDGRKEEEEAAIAASTPSEESTPETALPVVEEIDRPSRSILVWVLTTLAALSGLYIGFLVGFALLIVAVLVGMERERLWLALVVAVSAAGIAHFVFVSFLGIPLPDGIFFSV